MKVRVKRVKAIEAEKGVKEKKMSVLMPIKTIGSSLNGCLSRQLRQCREAILRFDDRWVLSVQRAQLSVGSGQNIITGKKKTTIEDR